RSAPDSPRRDQPGDGGPPRVPGGDGDAAAAGRGPDRGGHGSARRGREGSHGGPFGSKFVSMATRLVHPVVDAAEPARLARFWAEGLGWEVVDEAPDEVDVCPPGFSYPDPSALPLVFVPVPEPKNGKNRVHLDLATESVTHQAAEVERLLALGAVPAAIGQAPHADLPSTAPPAPARTQFS